MRSLAASVCVVALIALGSGTGLARPVAQGRLGSVTPREYRLIVAINAGGLFYVRRGYGWIPVIRDFLRLNSILYRQSTALRRREMVERFRAWETARTAGTPPPPWGRRGVLFGLTTSFTDGHPVSPEWADGRPERPELTQTLARVKTSFAHFDRETCEQLVYRGWWLTGATLATYHREVLPAVLPRWRG
jgi:NTE family protein